MKKKLMTALSAAALAGSLFSTAALAKEDNGKGSLVALGDSITFGYNLGVNNNHVSKLAFPFIIGDEEDLRVRDLGVPGWTTNNLLAALQTDDTFRDAVKHADVVTLDIGSNDLLQAFADGNVTQEEVSLVLDNLKTTIETIRKITNAPIVVYNIYNPFQGNDPRHVQGDMLLSGIPGYTPGINSFIQALVTSLSKYNVVLADAYSAFGQNQATYVRQYDIHPTVAGQEALAQAGLEALSIYDGE